MMVTCNVQGTDSHGALVVKVMGFELDGLGAVRRARLYENAPHMLAECEATLARLDLEAGERAARGEDDVFVGGGSRAGLRSLIARVKGL